jgi:hypothetical protein
MTMSNSLFDKLWQQHVVAELDAQSSLLHIDRVFLHERTGASALKSMAAAGRLVRDPARVFAVMDHIVDTRIGRGDQTLMQGGQAFITETREAALAAGITLFDVTDPDQGITHVISPELGIVLPGLTLVAPDSHTCTQGALGALAWGIGSSEAEHAMATAQGRDDVSRKGMARALDYMGLQPGQRLQDLPIEAAFIGSLHQQPPVRSARRRRRCCVGRQVAAGVKRHLRAPGSIAGQARRPRPKVIDRIFQGRRLRMARVGLLAVLLRRRRQLRPDAKRVISFHQPQLREPPGPAGAQFASGQPGHRGGFSALAGRIADPRSLKC